MIRRPPRSTQSRSSAASDVYKRQVKVRQPVYKRQLVGFTPAEQEAIQELSDIIKDELNLKELAFEQTARGLQEILLLPNLPILGPRFGKRLPAIRTALMGLSGCLLYTSDAADDLLCVDLGGRRIIKTKKKRSTGCTAYTYPSKNTCILEI